jgi:hypothetical protein
MMISLVEKRLAKVEQPARGGFEQAGQSVRDAGSAVQGFRRRGEYGIRRGVFQSVGDPATGVDETAEFEQGVGKRGFRGRGMRTFRHGELLGET